MKTSLCLLTWIAFSVACIISPASFWAADLEEFAVGRFSAMVPDGNVSGWEPLTFEKIKSHTQYRLIAENQGRTVLRADSHASASGLVRKINLSAGTYPWLTWRWKISNILEKGNVKEKSGDDYAARLYITFAEDPDDLSFFERAKIAAIKLFYGQVPPSAALAYVWGNQSPPGSIHPNPYTNRVQMIVVESGPAHVNQWRSARRNIVEDFRLAFGTDPPPITAIAVMTDTDNTGEKATAWYGDIALAGPH
ncbi:conserved uncharacterized protein, DUF3047 [Desulfosarcina variabilis str. Montpellier]|uniref:DUF3047 domain-containing protein n=1 Tax=Desulfosarcina variabilis TaxID=2300 RepID=UPI003AFB128B